ncbi:MAG: hypothetical protein GQ575_02560 [Deltaproteobacteria bacterium]|nr:hypothetical protein [Deltaproteobacteria bacterium]
MNNRSYAIDKQDEKRNLLLTQALVSCNRKTSFIPPCPDRFCSICILDQGRII